MPLRKRNVSFLVYENNKRNSRGALYQNKTENREEEVKPSKDVS